MDKQLNKQNAGIISLSVIILVWTLLVASLAKADLSDLLGRNTQPGACRKVKVKDLSPELHFQEGMRDKENKKYCPAMAHFTRAYVLAEYADLKTKAQFNKVESAFYQMDYELFFSEAENFMKKNPAGSSPESERVHFLMIKGAYEILLESDEKKGWNDLLLGVSKLQQDPTSSKSLYSIPLFLEKFPNSIYAPEIKDLHITLRNDTAKEMLSEAHRLWSRGYYVPAMGRAKWIVAQGAYLPEFPVALYTLINITDSFAAVLTLKNKIDHKLLAEWLSVEESEITPEVKAELAASLHQEALKMVAQMREQLPDNPWTHKLNFMYSKKK